MIPFASKAAWTGHPGESLTMGFMIKSEPRSYQINYEFRLLRQKKEHGRSGRERHWPANPRESARIKKQLLTFPHSRSSSHYSRAKQNPAVTDTVL
jgi:hypothetical protein